MVLPWKRRLLLGLGLTVALGLAVALPATASAVSTLTGETLSGSSSFGNSNNCPTGGISTFSVSGTATGPYAGTFTETGTLQFLNFNATFTITSGTTTITGSKGPGTLGGSGGCSSLDNSVSATYRYTATIHTPNGNFHDEGRSAVQSSVFTSGAANLTETFTSSLAEPTLISPTSKSQCKKGGWRNFPQFKNQGRCVRFVVTGKLHTSSPGSKAQGRGKRSKAPK